MRSLRIGSSIVSATAARGSSHPPGQLRIWDDLIVEDDGWPDPLATVGSPGPVEQLPYELLVYLLGSRYCEVDRLTDIAWNLFGGVVGGVGAGAGGLRLGAQQRAVRLPVRPSHQDGLRGLRGADRASAATSPTWR